MQTPCRCTVAPVAVPGRRDLVTCPACGVFARVPASLPAPAPADPLPDVKVNPHTLKETAGPGSPAVDWPGTPGHADPGPTVAKVRAPARRGRGGGGGG